MKGKFRKDLGFDIDELFKEKYGSNFGKKEKDSEEEEGEGEGGEEKPVGEKNESYSFNPADVDAAVVK